MPKTIERTVYEFDELSDCAKNTARDWYRQGIEFDANCVIEDAARMADMIGINLRTRPVRLMNGGIRHEPAVSWSGFYSQGDGASWEGSYRFRRGSVTAIANEAPESGGKGNVELNRIARALANVQRRNFYQLQADVAQRGRYSPSRTMVVDVGRIDDKPVSNNDTETLTQLLRDFADWIYRQLEQEYDYQTSNDTVDENIRANEYTFDENGNRER